jgi:hypothetical protein
LAVLTYTGIDHHKRYSVACTLDAQGRLLQQARIDHHTPEAFAAYFQSLHDPAERTGSGFVVCGWQRRNDQAARCTPAEAVTHPASSSAGAPSGGVLPAGGGPSDSPA